MIRGLDKIAQQFGLEPNKTKPNMNRLQQELYAEEVPMMYRAQISGRCSLLYAGSHEYRDKWTEEWVNPKDNEYSPRYQHSDAEELIADGYFCRFRMTFPGRVFTNCGQDSIHRPVMDVQGIPFIPGSSIKGLFRRACQKRDRDKSEAEKLTNKYCGDKKELKPGILRFHGAYPVADWAGTITVSQQINYRIVDVVHSQQDWQVGKQKKKTTNAIAQISLSQPTLIFEISSTESLKIDKWETIIGILKQGLSQGLGGKTSSGYGLPFRAIFPEIQVRLIGTGITPVLLSGEPEFRPNIFKAILRGHTSRLLAGCTSQPNDVNKRVDRLFGNTKSPSKVEIYWELKTPPENQQWSETFERLEGDLFLRTGNTNDTQFIKSVLKFAYTMGGFGKSWRRVWHKKFYKSDYDKLIGCHWQSNNDWIDDIKTPEKLKEFLDSLERDCRTYLLGNSSQPLDWRETWHRNRVAVYTCGETKKSKAIHLFHDSTFKTTPAIGGKNLGDDRPTKVSSVWHRMLPLENNQYLEIVTVFHGGNASSCWRQDWNNQLKPFTDELTRNGLKLTWGTSPSD